VGLLIVVFLSFGPVHDAHHSRNTVEWRGQARSMPCQGEKVKAMAKPWCSAVNGENAAQTDLVCRSTLDL
jgi:hypothetical protein